MKMGDIVVPTPVLRDKNVGFVLLKGTNETRLENDENPEVATAEVTEEWDGRISRCIIMPQSQQVTFINSNKE
jgi:hypothetical protein